MSASTVYVKNISDSTSEKEIKEFFSFCGKITSLNVTSGGSTKEATVVFEKETAAKTALLLDNTQLGKTQVTVTSAAGSDDKVSPEAHHGDHDSDEITQEMKPRSRIIAEYLAHGYQITDIAAQRALDLDQKHGVSSKFLQTLQDLDKKTQATQKAKSVDQSYGITATAQNTASTIWSGLNSYYEKAVGTPTGQKLAKFYTDTQRQVVDIHTEARRLADLKKTDGKPATETGKTTCKCGSDSSSCPCAPGACACTNCAKSDVRTVAGTDKTTCNCGGKTADCACEDGHCACTSCPKSTKESVSGTDKTKCSCGGDDGNCACEPGQCACSGCAK